MDLITADGKYFIDQKDYEILHDLHKRLPEYMKATELAIRATDASIKELSIRRNTLSKFRRQLGEVHGVFQALNKKEGV